MITRTSTFKPLDLETVGRRGLVLAGARGIIFEHTVSRLDRIGIRPLAIVDNDTSLWGSRVNATTIQSPAQGVNNFPTAVFVATIFTHTPLRRQLTELGASCVIPYAALFRSFPSTFLPYFAISDPIILTEQANEARAAGEVWADEESRMLYKGILNWFLTLESESVPPPLPSKEIYFPPFLELVSDEVFVDCGAFDGDTIRQFISVCSGRYKKIIAIEPDPKTFHRLTAYSGILPRTTALNAAVGAEGGKVTFIAGGSLASHALAAGAEGLSISGSLVDVEVLCLDDLAPYPTYVKMDIEGSELEALAGARNLLRAGATAFAVSLYHRASDLWKIPLYIGATAPDLRLYLRHHAEDWAETICYAIPAGKIRATGAPHLMDEQVS